MKKRLLALFLLGIITTSAFSGCGDQAASSTTESTSSTIGDSSAAVSSSEIESSTAASQAGSTEPTTITVINRVNPEIVFDNNPMLEQVAEKSGVTLEIDAPPISNYNDRLQIVMASGELPDLIYTWGFDPKYNMWAKDDLTWALDDFVGDYENLMHNVTPQMWEVARTTSTGKIHAVPRAHVEPMWGVVANTKWLEALETEMPKTTEELFEYGKLVRDNDPDGNGKKDTFLMSPTNVWTDCWLVTAFMPFPEKGLPDNDGNFKIREKMSGYIPYLTYMRNMYAEGIMDPEFFTNNYYDDRTKLYQNRVGVMHGQIGNVASSTSDVPDGMEIFKFFPPIVGPEHSEPENHAAPATWGGWQINKELPEDRVHRILAFLDWANSKEGFVTMAAGIEGMHYETYDFDTRSLIKTTEQGELAKTHLSGYMTMANAFEGLGVSPADSQVKIDLCNAERKFFSENTKTVPVVTVQSAEYDDWKAANPDLYSKKEEIEVSYIVGETSLEDLQKFLDTEYYPSVADAEKAYIETATLAASK